MEIVPPELCIGAPGAKTDGVGADPSAAAHTAARRILLPQHRERVAARRRRVIEEPQAVRFIHQHANLQVDDFLLLGPPLLQQGTQVLEPLFHLCQLALAMLHVRFEILVQQCGQRFLGRRFGLFILRLDKLFG